MKKIIQVWIDEKILKEFEDINKKNVRKKPDVLRKLIEMYVKNKGDFEK